MATTTLYPLVYSSGVQRDGTTFQSTYCTDAQWIRFQRDKIKKIGGMKGIASNIESKTTNIRVFPSSENTEILIVTCNSTGIRVNNCTASWDITGVTRRLLTVPESANTMWESEVVIDPMVREGQVATSPAKSYIVFMKTSNALDINDQNTAAQFYYKEISTLSARDLTPAILIPFAPPNTISPLINGNLCFAAPYLFLFGSNGEVQFSSERSPFNFTTTARFTASADKIIYGRPIRGGPNVPSLLLWTLSSVVRVTNTGPAPDGTPLFKSETISTGSSILSSKCVVEYDGFFFWPGTDRFYAYTGIVDELPNRLNQNYFFDNIDMSRRQQVFGVKEAKYGEIWWFYPVKGVPGANSRAIVYNKRENFWYDTAISREAGTYSNNFGFMVTNGAALVNPDGTNYLWRHEFGTTQEKVRTIAPIPSYFTAPLFSWAAFPPKITKQSQPAQLVNRWVDLQRIEPDFVDTNPIGVSKFQIVVSTREYAQSKITEYPAIEFDSNTGKIDMRVQGRNMTLKFSSSDKFEVGQIMLLIGLGDGR